MIRARGVEGQKIAVLGLGRTGISAAKALMAGGAVVLAWDDGEPARQRAAQEGIPVHDLTSIRDWSGIATLITSPGIPHLYPAPHPVGTPLVVLHLIMTSSPPFADESWCNLRPHPRSLP